MSSARLPCARNGYRRSRTNGTLQDRQELLNPGFLFSPEFPLPAEKAWVQLCSEQSILEAFDGPIQDGDNHLYIQILAQFAVFQSKAYKVHCAVRILGDQEAVDLTLQH